ncbi:MAG: restriction endonuclease [Deltaproteobacteria bacterium]|jgi:restriction system protein|nr:restriction endonuclease [Deltaproteobacteria bacterium]
MAIPTFQEVMLPILKLFRDKDTYSVKNCVENMEREFQLEDEEIQKRIPTGRQRVIYNRVSWAITHLKSAGLLEHHEKRGNYGITDEGIKLLAQNPSEINMRLLSQYDSYKSFLRSPEQEVNVTSPKTTDADKTPEEIMGTLAETLDLQLTEELLEAIYNNTPAFFETLVVDLLLKMGYGGLEGSGEVTKMTGDGGIDGVIKQDALGLDLLYIQAKRWDKGRPVPIDELQKFVGAITGSGAKAVFITTSSFSKPAVDYKKGIHKLSIIDGLTLAKLMIKYDLGVQTSNIIRIKKVDSDYFDEQQAIINDVSKYITIIFQAKLYRSVIRDKSRIDKLSRRVFYCIIMAKGRSLYSAKISQMKTCREGKR